MTEDGQQQAQKYHPLHDDLQSITEQSPQQPSGVWSTLGMLANMVRSVTGRSRWSDDPPTNLTEAKAHHDATGNVHNLTRAQLGAAAQTALDSHTADQQNPHGVTAQQAGALPATQKGAASGVAPLDAASRIPSIHIPPVALTERFVVNSQSAQLALTAQEGDVAIRTDQSRTYIRNSGTAGTMADWNELATPPDAIQSVDGRTGTVSLSDRYAPASHVGSRDGHPLATATQNGLYPAADKSKLDSLVPPQRVYVAPSWSTQTINVTSIGWQPTILTPEISVPTLGAAPAGFKWLLDIEGGIRIRPPAANASVFLTLTYDRAAQTGTVEGGGTLFASSQGALPVFRYGADPPATNRAFTVNFWMWVSATGDYQVLTGPNPACRAYLVAL